MSISSRILPGDIGPMRAMVTRKLRVEGRSAYILRNMPTVLDFVRVARNVPIAGRGLSWHGQGSTEPMPRCMVTQKGKRVFETQEELLQGFAGLHQRTRGTGEEGARCAGTWYSGSTNHDVL